MQGILELFQEYSEPDEFHVQVQLELFAWGRIERQGHGYVAYTTYKCRCDICRQANRDYMRDYLARRKRKEQAKLLAARAEARRTYWRTWKAAKRAEARAA